MRSRSAARALLRQVFAALAGGVAECHRYFFFKRGSCQPYMKVSDLSWRR